MTRSEVTDAWSNATLTNPCAPQLHYVVPYTTSFVMGDNRSNSNDSRYWGSVPEDHVVGRAIGIWLPFGRNWIRSTDLPRRRFLLRRASMRAFALRMGLAAISVDESTNHRDAGAGTDVTPLGSPPRGRSYSHRGNTLRRPLRGDRGFSSEPDQRAPRQGPHHRLVELGRRAQAGAQLLVCAARSPRPDPNARPANHRGAGRGHRHNASRITSTRPFVPAPWAHASSTAARAIAGFHPSPTRASLAWARITASSSFGDAPTRAPSCSSAPTWTPRFSSSAREAGACSRAATASPTALASLRRETSSRSAVPLIVSRPAWCASWQELQAKMRFRGTCPPPSAWWRRWWISRPRVLRQPGIRQRPWSRRQTRRITLGGTS